MSEENKEIIPEKTQSEIDAEFMLEYNKAMEFANRNALILKNDHQTPDTCMKIFMEEPWTLEHLNPAIPNSLDLNNPEHLAFYKLGWRDGDVARMCLTAVKQSGLALIYVKEQTPEICLAAVTNKEWSITYVKDLHSIAHLLSEKTIEQGLKIDDQEIRDLYHIVVKLKESHHIAERINDAVPTSINSVNKKSRL